MRIADNMQFDQVTENLRKNRSDMADLQNKAATQKRVTKPSDDPVAASRVLTSRIELQGQNQYLKNLNYASSFLEYTDQSLEELTNILVRAKELALSQANDASANEQSRKVVGEELAQIYKQAILIGNRKIGDRYIFGGYKTTTPPFSFSGGYGGDEGEMLINVDKGSYVSMNVPGSKVFKGINLSDDGITHTTTEQPIHVEDLEKQRNQEMDKKNAPPVEENKFKRNDEFELRGLASVEEPSEMTPVPNKSGSDIFKTIKNLEIGLKADDKWAVQNAIDDTEKAIQQVILSRSQVGSKVMTIKNANETLLKGRVDSADSISQLEDVDVYKVVSDINKNESTLKATLATSGKLIQPSLLDFLR